MNMTDMLLQAINQGAWALPNLNTSTTKPAGQESRIVAMSFCEPRS